MRAERNRVKGRMAVGNAVKKLNASPNRAFAPMFQHGTLVVESYAPEDFTDNFATWVLFYGPEGGGLP